MTVTQTVSFTIDIDAALTAKMVRNDYGVPGSPVWYDAEDHDFADLTITIAGVDIAIKDLPPVLRDAILSDAIYNCDNATTNNRRQGFASP